MDPQRLPRQTIAEIGGLAVIARYRNRRDEDKSPAPLNDESFGTKERPRFPYLTVGLYLATIELARLHNIATLFVLTGPCARRRFPRWKSRPCSASWRRSRRGISIGHPLGTISCEGRLHGSITPSMSCWRAACDDL